MRSMTVEHVLNVDAVMPRTQMEQQRRAALHHDDTGVLASELIPPLLKNLSGFGSVC
jgi:hypothetical protein